MPPPVSATSVGHTATVTSRFDFQHGDFLILFCSNRSLQTHRFEPYVHTNLYSAKNRENESEPGTEDEQTDGRTDRSVA